MREAIEKAIANKDGFRFVPLRQPIVNLDCFPSIEQPDFYELLTAIRIPQVREPIAASYFIRDIQENDDWSHALDDWAIAIAAKQIALTGHRYTVNLTGATLRRQDYLPQVIAETLRLHNAPQSRFCVELPERYRPDNLTIKNLKVIGTSIGLILDDVGGQYSNHDPIAHLAGDFPLYGFKFDIYLTSRLDKPHVCEVVGALLYAAQNNGWVAIAEGVEEQWQIDTLLELRQKHAKGAIVYAQGWLVGMPQEIM